MQVLRVFLSIGLKAMLNGTLTLSHSRRCLFNVLICYSQDSAAESAILRFRACVGHRLRCDRNLPDANLVRGLLISR
jgi:hypothetical protein